MRDLVAGGQIEVHALATEVAQTLLHESLERGGKLRGKEKGGKLRGKEVDRGEKNKQLEAKRWGTKGKCVFSYFIVIIIKSKQLVAIVLVLLPSSPPPPPPPPYFLSLSPTSTFFPSLFLPLFISYLLFLSSFCLLLIDSSVCRWKSRAVLMCTKRCRPLPTPSLSWDTRRA